MDFVLSDYRVCIWVFFSSLVRDMWLEWNLPRGQPTDRKRWNDYFSQGRLKTLITNLQFYLASETPQSWREKQWFDSLLSTRTCPPFFRQILQKLFPLSKKINFYFFPFYDAAPRFLITSFSTFIVFGKQPFVCIWGHWFSSSNTSMKVTWAVWQRKYTRVCR